jgi:cytochrome c-type biogenesis protein
MLNVLQDAAAAFAAGIVTSFGPCAAPRYIALAGVIGTTHGRRRRLRVLAFISGLYALSVAVAFSVSLLSAALRYSTLLYAAMAVVFAVCGVRVLVHPRSQCMHVHSRGDASLSGAFLLGGSFAFVLSPCCAPVLGAIPMLLATGSASSTLAVLGAFIAGHSLPLVATGGGSVFVERIERAFPLEAPASVTSGALMLAMSAYYAVLA